MIDCKKSSISKALSFGHHSVLLALFLLFVSCVPQSNSGSGRKSKSTQSTSSSSTPSTTTSPSFSDSLTYLQKGATQSTTLLTLGTDFTDVIYLRGKQVHEYQVKGSNTQAVCVMTNFSASLGSQILILAARPQTFNNFALGTQEAYYVISPNDSSINKSFCQTTGTISKAQALYGAVAIAYATADLCPSCTNTSLTSAALKLVDKGGSDISNIIVSHLGLKIQNQNSTSTTTTGTSCTSTIECTQKGYDCCSTGICVKDRQVKSGVNQSSAEFLQSVADILVNSANINNYPQFYHLCSISVLPTPSPTSGYSAEELAAIHLQNLKELYECTTPVKGEKSICTKVYHNITTNPVDFVTGSDDRNFNSTYSGTGSLSTHSIVSITHAGTTLFSELGASSGSTYQINGVNPGGSFIPSAGSVPGTGTIGLGNDTMTDPVRVYINHTATSSAKDDDLKIRFKIDGSCSYVNSSLAQCKKYYVQGQNTSNVDDHYPASNIFCLPTYADTTKTIKMEVDEAIIPQGGVNMDWQVISSPCKGVQFTSASLQVYDTQKVIITYYVNLASYNVLQSKLDALNEIDQMCNCGGPYCSLKPVTQKDSNNNDVVVDYACVYPTPAYSEPLQQEVYLSAKSIPVRYYDSSGVYQKTIDTSTSAQEGSAFKYTNSDLLKPNNVSGSSVNYIGFNEIYGSLTLDATSAKLPGQVNITSGKTYDIFVDTGSFSQCASCGQDYYSGLAKLFPANFLHKGAGYQPDGTTTNQFQSSTYRKDDLIFGRACFLPATMIPWSHRPQSDRQTQRKDRMAAQHFYFANGYQRDWFGFDYGSVIGSFDGIRWFAVGNQRRIKAQSNRLFLAVNAYFGDITLDATYKVVVSDASNALGSGAQSTTDYSNDGAQCQQFHACDSDKDCVTQLGWEYMCTSVSSISSAWPVFDANGTEIPNNTQSVALSALTGASLGASKRCVYRGAGAPCMTSYTSSTTSFNGTVNSTSGSEAIAANSCAPNFYCQTISGSPSVFNSAIARFGKSVAAQNAASSLGVSDGDTFGKGARLIGRPLNYQGSQTFPTGVLAQLNYNAVQGVCLPGRNAGATSSASTSLSSLHATTPLTTQKGDLVGGLGMTIDSGSATTGLFNSCPIIDPENGNYYFRDNPSTTLGNDNKLTRYSGTQNLSTRHLGIFQGSIFDVENLVTNFSSTQVTSAILEENRCLRAPGSACHSDLDCAPSKFIADKLATVDVLDTFLYNTLNRYEIQFWQEGLICHQDKEKTDAAYSLKNNRCCRAMGNKVTIGTRMELTAGTVESSDSPDINATSLAGVDAGISTSTRYSRVATVNKELQGYKLSTDSNSQYAPLVVAGKDSCSGGCRDCTVSPTLCPVSPLATPTYASSLSAFIKAQANTFALTAERTCCTKNWVRHFHEDNGGGHIWDSDKLQKIKNKNFKCLNWDTCTHDSDPNNALSNQCWPQDNPNFSCDGTTFPNDSNCRVRNISLSEGKKVMDHLRRLDLLGIPQIMVEQNAPELECKVDPDDQTVNGTALAAQNKLYLNSSIYKDFTTTAEWSEVPDVYYSAADITNFNEQNIKPIFSPDTISCCKPAGTIMNAGETANNCCTGYVDSTNRCVLKRNYTNVSVYFNRFVSSAAKDLNPAFFDPATGAITDPNIVAQLACSLNVCESRVMARGVALSYLKVPGHESGSETYRTRRFVDGNSANGNGGLSDLFDAGMKWNDDIYCVPAELENAVPSSESVNVLFFKC